MRGFWLKWDTGTLLEVGVVEEDETETKLGEMYDPDMLLINGIVLESNVTQAAARWIVPKYSGIFDITLNHSC